ncbi:hypothetical protein [Duganella sp. HH101]|uniref:hypothetical protein n=1 Tax=Duganella sp. HH101 TaxID=1781066 RepID=UPI00114CC6B4|nr:hypothetical protein [Duganella sp. HH101]
MNISQSMGGQTYFDKQEQGVFIVREANGDLRVGNIAVGTAFGVNAEISTNAGEKIVAMIHTHPPSAGSDTRLPSNIFNHADGGPGDVADAARMMAGGAVDPGVLYYIVDRSGTYEYTWSGPEIRLIGSDIAHDSVRCG